MNFQSIILKRCKDEFYNLEETKVTFPFYMNEEEKQSRFIDIKLGNIRLISDFYLNVNSIAFNDYKPNRIDPTRALLNEAPILI